MNSKGRVAWRSREVAVGLGLILITWMLAVGFGYGQEWPNDFSAFYFMARGMRLLGLGLNHQLYSLAVQYALEGVVRKHGAGLTVPFVNPPIAAWIIMPFTYLPLRMAYLVWDLTGLMAAGGGLWWMRIIHKDVSGLGLVAMAGLASYPTYIALGQGQFDLLWPLAVALAVSTITVVGYRFWAPRVIVSALIVALKPDLFLGLLVPALSRWRDARVRAFGATLVVFGLAVVLILGPAGLGQAAHIELFTIAKRFPPTNDVTVLGFFWRLLGPGQPASVLGAIGIPLGIAIQAWVWWRNPPRSDSDWWLALASAFCVSLLIAPHDLTYGLLLLTPAALWVALAFRSQGRSLVSLGWWMLLINVAAIIDLSPHLELPIKFTPLLLGAAAICLWRARKWSPSPSLDIQGTGHADETA